MNASAKPAKRVENVTFRWVDVHATARDTEAFRRTEEDFDRIEAILSMRGWASLNRNTSRVLIAEDAQGALVGFICFQMAPYTGPEFVVPSHRGSGLAEELAERMLQFLGESNARGWIAIAENAHSVELMEKFGMTRVKQPVYVMPFGGLGGMEV